VWTYNVKKYWGSNEQILTEILEKSSDGIAKLDVLDFVENVLLSGLGGVAIQPT
jgi:hypothetical protein